MDTTTVLCGLLAAWAALPALDAFLRLRRLAAPRGGARDARDARAPRRILAVIPARAEGARVGDLAGALKEVVKRREEKISANERGTGSAAPPGATRGSVDVLVLLDGPDPDAETRLIHDGIQYLSKKPPGPSKGHALAFVGQQLAKDLDSYEFILVFDADMRLPEGFLRDLAVPDGTEAFQLPVRPEGVPAPGAPRLEALSLAEAARDDLARSAEGLPVRLRGKAMGFSPRAFRLGPAASTRTTVEDSEATLRLLTAGVRILALEGPTAFDEPSRDARAMARSRSRWFGGHLKLLFAGLGDLARLAVRSPKGAFVLACDLWLRPRLLVLITLAILAAGSDVALLIFSSNGTWSGVARGVGGAASVGAVLAARSTAPREPILLLAFLLLLSFEAKLALVFEGFSLAALRRLIGYPAEVPAVSFIDVIASLRMWIGAVFRGILAPSRWHRARPAA